MQINLTGRSYLVVAGARGIGAAICRRIACSGGEVAWTYLDNEADRKGTGQLEAEFRSQGIRYRARPVDCTNHSDTAQFCEELAGAWPHLSGLVFCAGYTAPRPFLEIAPDEWQKLLEINLSGAFYATRAVVPHFKNKGRGAIVLLGSAAIVAGGGGRADYVAAKAGLEGLSRALTKEFGPCGIRCNIVHPSLIETDLLRQRHPDPEKRKQLAEQVPLRRLGRPDDVAHAVVFLLSDCADYITGQSLFVDGGRTFCK